jgi:hypothetical protein
VPLGLMMNPVMNHLNLLVQVEAREQLPRFCLLTQDLPPISLERAKVVGSAIPPSTSASSARSGTRHLRPPSRTSPLDPARLHEIQEGILQHNLEYQDVQAHLNSKRQRLHQVAVKYGLSMNLWTAIVLMISALLLEASHVSSFIVYDCSPDQLKTLPRTARTPRQTSTR